MNIKIGDIFHILVATAIWSVVYGLLSANLLKTQDI